MSKRKGFTLIEVAIAAVVVLLSVALIPALFLGNLRHHRTMIQADHQTYFVQRYEENSGCVQFDDWTGHHKICGNYQIRN